VQIGRIFRLTVVAGADMENFNISAVTSAEVTMMKFSTWGSAEDFLSKRTREKYIQDMSEFT
jgi:hypothetical protein